MSRFKDVYLDSKVPGYPAMSSPRFSTDIVIVDSGDEQVNQRWNNPLNKFTLPDAIRDMDILNSVRRHWLIMKGPAYIWPFRDPLDFASVDIEEQATIPTITPFDQNIGVSDGVTRSFQITKLYEVVGNSETFQYIRKIQLPVVSSVRISVNGSEVLSGFTVERESGIITFDVPPPVPGSGTNAITCGFLFDVPVRFEADDSFDAMVVAVTMGSVGNLNLLETRLC